MPVLECSAQVEFLDLGIINISAFHVRASKSSLCSSGFRSVSFTLQSKDVLSTVMDVLKSCSLPVEHMSGLKSSAGKSSRAPEAAVSFYRPIKWDKSYYSFTGFRDPEEELQRARRMAPTLRSSMCFLKDGSAVSISA